MAPSLTFGCTQEKDGLTPLTPLSRSVCTGVLTLSPPTRRYQPGALTSSSQEEKLVELVEGEKVAVSGGDDSGDEYGLEMEDTPLSETFSARLLFCPSGKVPTEVSGTIVYVTTAVICKPGP